MAKTNRRFKIRLAGTIPATAEMIVEGLATEEDARDYADEHPEEANWDGGDYSTPDGSTVEIVSIEEI